MSARGLFSTLAISAMGGVLIALGLYVHRRQHAISAWFDTKLPEWLRRRRPANATGI